MLRLRPPICNAREEISVAQIFLRTHARSVFAANTVQRILTSKQLLCKVCERALSFSTENCFGFCSMGFDITSTKYFSYPAPFPFASDWE
jgi:hypothetical protein